MNKRILELEQENNVLHQSQYELREKLENLNDTAKIMQNNDTHNVSARENNNNNNLKFRDDFDEHTLVSIFLVRIS